MPTAKHASLESSCSADELFAALLHVVQEGKYELGGISNETHQMLFRSRATAMSWGHHHAAGVTQVPTGSVLNLTTTGVPDAPKALLDGRRNQRAGDKLIQAVEAVLADPKRPSPQPVESYALLEDGTSVPWTDGDFPGA
jgi:hypothetical protein